MRIFPGQKNDRKCGHCKFVMLVLSRPSLLATLRCLGLNEHGRGDGLSSLIAFGGSDNFNGEG